MKTSTITKSVSYYDPNPALKAEDRQKVASKELPLNEVETNEEALAALQATPDALVKAANLLIRANAEADLSSLIPESCFTQSQVSGCAGLFRKMFPGLKSKALKDAVMANIVEKNMVGPMLLATAHLRNSENTESEE